MADSLSDIVTLAYAFEDGNGDPVAPWKRLEPIGISRFGNVTEKIRREFLTENRRPRRSRISRRTSGVGFTADLTLEHFLDFIQSFMRADFATTPRVFAPTAVTATGYTVAANGDLPDGTLIYARGFATDANNGLKVTAGTSTTTEVKAAGLTAEASPPGGAELAVCGVRGASGDITINASGNLASTALNFTTLGLSAGQGIAIGGDATGNRFGTLANRGIARIVSIGPNEIVLDKRMQAFSTDAGASKQIDIFFGPLLKDVPPSDALHNSTKIVFEGGYADLGGVGTTKWEYARHNLANEMGFDLPLNGKANISFGFLGTTTDDPTASQATGADTPNEPISTELFSTAADIARLRVSELDEDGLATAFKSLRLTLNNQLQEEYALREGTYYGPKNVNPGTFLITMDAEAFFDRSEIMAAINGNTTVTLDFALRNGDGGFYFDIPAMTLGDGSKNIQPGQTIGIRAPGEAFEGDDYEVLMHVTRFPYLPDYPSMTS